MRTGTDGATPAAYEAAVARLSSSLEAMSVLEATPECLVVAEVDGRIVFANGAVERLTGFTRLELAGKPVELLVATELTDAAAGARVESICRRADGGQVPVEVHVGRIDEPEPLLIVTLRDITDRQDAHDAAYEAEAKYRSLVEHIPAVVYLDPVDEDSDSIYVSPQVQELLGITPEEWTTDPYAWRRHVHPEDIERAFDEYKEAYNAHTVLNHEYRMLHEDGSVRWVLEQAYPIRDADGEPWLIQGVIFDITQRKAAEEQVAFLAYHDKLTGLPNRALFEELLEAAIARARRHDLAVGVVYLDLDNFKLVNDSLGHHAGDLLLAQLADRLRGCTRETDLVARQGGDEFLLLLSDLDRRVDGPDGALLVAESVAVRVLEALDEPFDLNGTHFYASGSLGISLFPHDATDADSLLRNADQAMYRSKRYEPGRYTVFSADGDDAMHRLSLTTRLREAVQQEHWVLHWQPIVRLADGTIEGLEALIRWDDPKGGILPPGEFIPLAEELGLIEAIGDWVISELARQQLEWKRAGHDVGVGFNLSPRQLWSAHLAEKVTSALTRETVDPRRVTVEVTESTAMADPDRTQKVLQELHAWGLTIALDDFGTGYSSLARLKHLPVDILKIDRSFGRDIDRDDGLASMVRAMIQLAEGLGMTALAEGVETAEEFAFLRESGCPLAQGYLFARPVPAAEVPSLLERGSLLPS
ncbi:MAG TPA: EAL domain-containing protein [Actinomycetota bacterium]|nr:EAL domain-containing protein [Actinomycetota bacterium]